MHVSLGLNRLKDMLIRALSLHGVVFAISCYTGPVYITYVLVVHRIYGEISIHCANQLTEAETKRPPFCIRHFKFICCMEIVLFLFKLHWNLFLGVSINNKPALVQSMAEPNIIMIWTKSCPCLLTHIYVTRQHWPNGLRNNFVIVTTNRSFDEMFAKVSHAVLYGKLLLLHQELLYY